MSTPATRRPPRDEVRRALLDAARTVFARRGIEAASMDEVAAAAGFTKGALYSNFAGKGALVDALVEDQMSAYLAVGLDAVTDESVTLAEQARRLGAAMSGVSAEVGDWHLLFLELWARAVRGADPDDPFLQRRRELRATVTAAVADHADRAGAELAFSPSEAATLIMALANGLAVEHQLEPGSVPTDLLGRVLELVVTAR